MDKLTFTQLFFAISVIHLMRYTFIAGGAYLFFWVKKNRLTEQRRIQTTPFKKKDLIREISLSVVSSFIFGGMLVSPLYFKDVSKIYFDVHQYGYLWWGASVVMLILIHDTYFYWMHRTVHHPKLFNLVHKVHHLSRNPTPFTAYSFHPLESVLEGIWIVPVLFFIPIHQEAAIVFGIYSLVMNVIGHLGVEIYPESWKTHPVMKWLNTSTLHNAHHRKYNENYGLYFLFWDRMMGTVKEAESTSAKPLHPIELQTEAG